MAYALLYFPYVLAEAVAGRAAVSYAVAWAGSIFILWAVLSGRIRPLPADRTLANQIMRPMVLTHVVFAGYTAITSIFFFLALNGVPWLSSGSISLAAPGLLSRTAEAQRYYVLAHAALAHGLLLAMDYRESGRWHVRTRMDLPRFLLRVAATTFAASLLLSAVPGLGQVVIRLQMVSLIASVLSLAVALPTRDAPLLVINGMLYAANFLRAALSGWKEEVIVMVGLLCVFAWPYYRRTMTLLTPALFIWLLLVLPAYNQIFRQLSWRGDVGAEDAARTAYQAVITGSVDMQDAAVDFLTGRASEIGLFVRYIEHTPSENAFSGTRTVREAVMALMPRAFWPGKPNLEREVMERVYRNGIVSRASTVSAKPQYVVDGYLAAGAFGVWLACLLLGVVASLASRLAERWFGGYLLGSGLVYTSLFTVFWRGNAFEFVLNPVIWSFIIMGVLFWTGRIAGLIVRAPLATRTPGYHLGSFDSVTSTAPPRALTAR